MGGSPGRCTMIGIFAAFVLSPAIAGLNSFRIAFLGLRSQKPRFTLGFMLAPASQAKTAGLYACACFGRLKADFSCKTPSRLYRKDLSFRPGFSPELNRTASTENRFSGFLTFAMDTR